MKSQSLVKHTPGPWKIDQLSHIITISTPGAGEAFDAISGRSVTPSNLLIARVSASIVPSKEEGLANARLIAAAPELLAACEFVLNHAIPDADGKHTVITNDAIGNILNAIAKAEGR